MRNLAHKSSFVDFDRMTLEHRLMAGSATHALRRALDRQAIDLPATTANNLLSAAHVPVLTSLILAIFNWSSTKRS